MALNARLNAVLFYGAADSLQAPSEPIARLGPFSAKTVFSNL
jgi:hypothetical protein